MKVAPLLHELEQRRDEGVDCKLVHTGQHYDPSMSEIFFSELGIRKPDISLEVGSGSHAVQTAAVMTKFEPVCLSERPGVVLVVGDVNSTMACTLVAAKLGIKVAHLEAGLRSFDRSMPEEINRLVTDALSDLLLTPTADADENLLKEGIANEKIKRVGNIMIDSLVANLPKARASRICEEMKIKPQKFVYVTLHRPANVDEPEQLRAIWACLEELADSFPVIFPVHPRTRRALAEFKLTNSSNQGLLLLNPVGYHDSLWLTENARFVLTDSGGLQEESTFFRTPCLTLRPNTERPITVSVGSNRLTELRRLSSDISDLLGKPSRFGSVPELWDGKTAQRTAAVLAGFGR